MGAIPSQNVMNQKPEFEQAGRLKSKHYQYQQFYARIRQKIINFFKGGNKP
jgi:hypothetical protein